jgi:hypothetical protein
MAQTVRELIAELSAIENQDQPIIFEGYLAEHFEFGDDKPTPTPEQFGEIIDSLVPNLFSEVYSEINDVVYDYITSLMCYECDEPISKLERAGNDGLCDSCQQLEESE